MERMVPRAIGSEALLDLHREPLLLLTLVFVDLQVNGGSTLHLLEVLEWHLMNLHRTLQALPGSHLEWT